MSAPLEIQSEKPTAPVAKAKVPTNSPANAPINASAAAFDPLDPQWQKPRVRDARGKVVVQPLSAAERQTREQIEPLLKAARRLALNGDHNGTRAKLKEIFAIDAKSAEGLELLGDIFLAEAQQEKAIQVFERGLQFHPSHHAFEEKSALALLDIEEMKRDRDFSMNLMQHGDRDQWQDRKAGVAGVLSLLVPGAGQIYNDDNERGYVFFGAALGSFVMWNVILNRVTANLSGATARQAIAQMGGIAKFGFWFFMLAWLFVVILAVVDAYNGAARANAGRRHMFGV